MEVSIDELKAFFILAMYYGACEKITSVTEKDVEAFVEMAKEENMIVTKRDFMAALDLMQKVKVGFFV